MLISQREAARILSEVGPSRRLAEKVLASGLAGTPVRTSSALLFDRSRVEALAAWPTIHPEEQQLVCPHGLFVARRLVDVTQPFEVQYDTATTNWDLSPYTRVYLRARVAEHGPMPFVAATCGWVTTAAEITTVLVAPNGRARFVVDPPGPWFDAFREHRVPTVPGRSWQILSYDDQASS